MSRGSSRNASPLRLCLTAVLGLACSSEASLSDADENAGDENAGGSSPTEEAGPALAPEADSRLPGSRVEFEVRRQEPVYINLEKSEPVSIEDPQSSDSWDIAFEGWNIFTNSGPSGPGDGGSFGPSDELNFLFNDLPQVPFLRGDTAGGAFEDWYDYDNEQHAVWSRFHVYGIRSGGALYKVQILQYYGEEFGAPVSALYRLRYAEVSPEGEGPITEIEELDGTAGHPMVSASTPSGCISLSTGDMMMLTEREAGRSDEWDLCFRRDVINVNGGAGGPGNVEAVNLQADAIADEPLQDIRERTADSELRRFEQVTYEDLIDASLDYRGDRVITPFADRWFDGQGAEATPVNGTWLVRGADGVSNYLVLFLELSGNEQSAGTVALQVRALEEEE